MRHWARREVLRGIGQLPLWAGLTAVVAACGGSSGSTSYGGSSSSAGGSTTLTCSSSPAVTYTVSGNHGHTACIPQAVLDVPQDTLVTLTAASTDGHTHSIALTAAEVAEIKNSMGAVAKTSDVTEAHTHVVTYPM
jgi:hypothetical protein